tara:strand:- start:777 stop:1103 length:327 start_codon:yes stop_codon:yes gene_type:complete
MPDVRFDEVIIVETEGKNNLEIDLDPNYVFVCEPNTIEPISYTSSEPCSCGLNVYGSKLIIEIVGDAPKVIRVKLSGIRKDYANKRFEKFTYDQMKANNAFWVQWKEQ